MSRIIYVHLGLPKTGTTSIQATFYRNRSRLRQAGFEYPGFAENHSNPLAAILAAEPHRLQSAMLAGVRTEAEGRTYKAKWQKLLDEALSQPDWDKLLISAEGLYYQQTDRLIALRELLLRYCDEVKPVICLRHPYWWRVSLIQQSLKSGDTLDNVISRLARPNLYRRTVRRFDEIFCANHNPLIFEELGNQAGGLVSGFASALGVSTELLAEDTLKHRNNSMSHRACLVIDRLNQDAPPFIDGRKSRQRSLTVDRILRRIPGPRFILQPDMAERMTKAVEADQRFVRNRLGRNVWPNGMPETLSEPPDTRFVDLGYWGGRLLGRLIP